MKNPMENIPAMLRVIAREIENGSIQADVGVLSLRKKGVRRPKVFGFGPVNGVNPVAECGRAVVELLRLSGTPEPTKEQARKAVDALSKI